MRAILLHYSGRVTRDNEPDKNEFIEQMAAYTRSQYSKSKEEFCRPGHLVVEESKKSFSELLEEIEE